MMENTQADPRRLKAVEENYQEICFRIGEAAVRAGKKPEDVRFMAVTKTVDPVYINQAIACGIDLIGENRVQEFLGKRDSLRLDRCEKHLIGHLQTNKVKQIVGQVDMIQSVSSIKLAEEISACSEKLGIVTPVLVEINIGKEESKSGFFIEEAEESLCRMSGLKGISVQGLMTIPPICENAAECGNFFSNMYQSFVDIGAKKIHNIDMRILSMGMSDDYELAIAHGSNLVRVGSALFGARNYG